MNIVKHQMIEYENIISYRCKTEDSEIPSMVQSIIRNIDVLDLNVCAPIIIGVHTAETEFIIPVDRAVKSSEGYYAYRPVFKLTNAARLRHYGSFRKIPDSIAALKTYLSDNSLVSDTDPYISVKNLEKNVYDVFIGVSENIL